MTNLEWVIDGASLTSQYGIRYDLPDSLSSSTLSMMLIMFAGPGTHATVQAGRSLCILNEVDSIYGVMEFAHERCNLYLQTSCSLSLISCI